jgi:hypothetical protein
MMPFCPACHCEYRPGFTRCTDCDIELVDSLSEDNPELVDSLSEDNPVEPELGELELVDLGSFPDPVEAQMIQELLEKNGIISILQSDFNAGAGTFTASPNALLVGKGDFLKARELYEQYFEGDQPEEQALTDAEDQDNENP